MEPEAVIASEMALSKQNIEATQISMDRQIILKKLHMGLKAVSPLKAGIINGEMAKVIIT